jgi:hypothetical protein
VIAHELPLYVRSRRIPAAVAVSLAAVAVVVASWSVWSDDAEVPPNLAALTVLFALVPWIRTLASHDDELEKTAAIAWPPRRVLHLVAVGAVVAAALLGAQVADIRFGAVGQVVRNSIGLAGLIGVSVALLGTVLAAIPPIIWVAVQAIAGASGGPAWRQSLLWVMQPTDSRAAAVTAGVLFLAGTAAYAVRVGPPRPPSEAGAGQ